MQTTPADVDAAERRIKQAQEAAAKAKRQDDAPIAKKALEAVELVRLQRSNIRLPLHHDRTGVLAAGGER